MFYIIVDPQSGEVVDKFETLQDAENELQRLDDTSLAVKAVSRFTVSKISVELPYKVSKDLENIRDWQEACIKRYAHDGIEKIWEFDSLEKAKEFMQTQPLTSIREFSNNGITYQVKEWFELSELNWLETGDCLEIRES